MIKKKIIFLSLSFSVALFILTFWYRGSCSGVEWCKRNWTTINAIREALFVFPIVFIIAFGTRGVLDSIIQKWARFTYLFIPAIWLFVFYKNTHFYGGLGIAGVVNRAFDDLLLAVFLGLYFFISLFLIITKSLQLRKKN